MIILNPDRRIADLVLRKSSRSKRKAERKIGSGRKGTVDEEEYLLKSMTKLVDRFSGTRGGCLHYAV